MGACIYYHHKYGYIARISFSFLALFNNIIECLLVFVRRHAAAACIAIINHGPMLLHI